MSKALKIVGGLLGLVVLAFAGVFVFLLTLDVEKWKPTIAAQVKAATGRDLEIKGKISPQFSWSPTLAVEGVSLANAPWAERRPMISVERFEAKLQLWPLLTSFGNTIVVDRVVLKGAEIRLETDEKGTGNWKLDTAAAAPSTAAGGSRAGAPPQVRVVSIELENVSLSFKPAKGAVMLLALERAAFSGPDDDTPRKATGNGRYNGLKFALDGQVGSVASILNGPFPLDLALAFGDRARIRVAGAVRAPLATKDYELQIGVEAVEVGRLGEMAAEAGTPGIAVPALGALSVDLRVADKGPNGRPSWTALRATLGAPEVLRLAVEGTIRDPLGPAQTPPAALGAALKLQGASADLARLAQKLGTPAPLSGPLKLAAELADQGTDKIALKGFSLEAAGSDLAGEGVLAFGGDKPTVTGSFASKLVDLVTLTPPDGAGGGGAGGATAKPDGRVIPDAPLPLALLDAANANLRYRAGVIAAPAAKLANFELAAALTNGVLTVKPLSFEMDGGRFAFETTVNGKQRTLAQKGEVRQLEVGRILQERKLNDWFRGGRTSLDMNVRGSGDSLRQIAGTLAGDVAVAMGPGEIGQALQRLLGQWLAGISPPLAQIQIGTSVRCGAYSVGFSNGVGTLRNGVIETPLITAQTSGSFNLGNETLNLRTIAGPIGVRTGGTFANPSTTVDLGSTLQGVVGGAAGAAVGAAGGVVGGVLGAVTGSGTGGGSSGCGGAGSGGGAAPAQQQRPSVPLPGGGSVPLPSLPNPFRR